MDNKKKLFIALGIIVCLGLAVLAVVLIFYGNSINRVTNRVSLQIDKQGKWTFDKMFNYIDPKQDLVKDSSPDDITLIATGDVIPARSVNSKLVSLNDFNYPFKDTVGFLKTADMVFINLESPLIPNCKTTLEGMIFCGDTRFISGLKFAGVTVANLANNHAGNYGIDGINSTVNLLKQNNILVTGDASNSAIVNVKGKKFGFLGYNDIGAPEEGISWANADNIKNDIVSLKKKVNFVIVTFHWGVEYTSTPSAMQVELAHDAVDGGADLVIGNHPHWVEGVEKYKGKFITYAHGNYIFDQMWSQETREGVLGRYTFDSKGVKKIEFVPVIIDDYSKARFAKKEEAQKILTDLKRSSVLSSF